MGLPMSFEVHYHRENPSQFGPASYNQGLQLFIKSRQPPRHALLHPTQLSYIYIPPAVPAIQGGCIHPTHARALATRPTTDQLETPRPKLKLGLDREMPYIVGELAVTDLT